MYTNLKSYQIIIALLKQYNIKHLVLSAGSRNVPFVHSVEEDPFFKCYSVVDERSAAYFAMGLAQQIQEPVLISCTASTASSNYWPAVGEAFYQGVPIVILTSDRNPTMLHQWEDQMIDQVGMFDRHVRKSVNLPIINDNDDWLFCQRLVNEALLELDHNGTGPVHINVPMKEYCNSFEYDKLPQVTKINRLGIFSDALLWKEKLEKLQSYKRILITCGQNSYISTALNKSLTTFFQKFNVAISVEHMSNVECEGTILTTVCMDGKYINTKTFEEFIPDLVISFGYNIYQGLKEQLRKFQGKYEHWSIQPDGTVVDMYKSLTTIFECPATYFFDYFNDHTDDLSKNDMQYYTQLKTYASSVVFPNFKYSNIYAIRKVVENIPADSILHLSINNSIRITNFFKIQPNVKVYANIGTYGIDGCLSSLIGQAAVTNKLCFLIIGDLSFFYDMNALRIRHIGNNIRILMINNQGGGEFYYNGSWNNQASDLHTTARHYTKAEGWIKENNFMYLSAHDEKTFSESFKTFIDPNTNESIFLEVFTEMKNDSETIHSFYDSSRPRNMKEEFIKEGKKIGKSILSTSTIRTIKEIIKK